MYIIVNCALALQFIILATGSPLYFFDVYLDSNRDGLVCADELGKAICKQMKNQCSISSLQLKKIMDKIDMDKSGTISQSEFVTQVGKHKKTSQNFNAKFSRNEKIMDPIEPGPQQVHLALTTDPSSVVVQWVSKDKDEPATVNYSLNSNGPYSSAQGITYTYSAGVFGWNGWIHKVVLTQLKSDTQYYYVVGGNERWSAQFSFRTAPGPNDPHFSSNVFGIVADQGTYIPMGWAVIDQMVNDHKVTPFSMILHAGDVCYAGTGSEWEYEDVWDLWEDLVEPLAANIPYMFSIGNHEHYYNWSAFTNRFTMPGIASGGNGNFWYSFDYGNVHFTMFSTEHDFSKGSIQYNWIEQDLEKAATNKPWIIMSGHRPWYNSDVSEWNDHTVGGRIQTQLEPLMVKYGVHIYLCGHQHMYERIHPTINGTVVDNGGSQKNFYINPKSPASVVQATAGVFLDEEFVSPQPSWSAYRTSEWGYGKMTVNETHIHYQFLMESDGSVRDQFWIQRN